MSLPRVPSPEDTKARLAWLLPDIYRAFEHGVFKANNYFDAEGIDHEPFSFAALVRLHAKDYLKKKGHENLELERVMLCGLSLRTEEELIKIWKSDDSELPTPGTSVPKAAFYQQSFDFEDRAADAEDNGVLRLVILWNLSSLRKNLEALWLVCPKSYDEKKPEAWWCTQIADPTSLVTAPPEPCAFPDLDMRRKVIPKKETGNG